MKEIQLTRGKVALVDDADYAELNKYRWFTKRMPEDHKDKYLACRVAKKDSFGVRYTLCMARVITKVTATQIVVHLNENTLDNRRSNLQVF